MRDKRIDSLIFFFLFLIVQFYPPPPFANILHLNFLRFTPPPPTPPSSDPEKRKKAEDNEANPSENGKSNDAEGKKSITFKSTRPSTVLTAVGGGVEILYII